MHAFKRSTWGQRQVTLRELEASLVYIVSCRPKYKETLSHFFF